MGAALPVSTEISNSNLKKYTGTAEKALKLLIAGADQTQVAKSLGVDRSFVSHLMQEDDFKLQVETGQKFKSIRATEIDESYEEMEHQALSRLKIITPLATNLDQLMRIAKFANEAKRKVTVNPVGDDNKDAPRTARLLLPTVILPTLIVNEKNEIVSVGERTLVTLNSSSINSLVDQLKIKESKEREILDVTPIIDKELQSGKEYDKWSPENL